jgi:hypothetical protein
MNEEITKNEKWCENVILVDADYIDKVAFDLTVNFERMIMRPISKADMAHWIDCVALDGGVHEGDNKIQVVFLHNKNISSLEYFTPSNFKEELNGKAFSDNIGEFMMSSFPTGDIVSSEDFFIDALDLIIRAKEVKRIMVIPNTETNYNNVRMKLHTLDDDSKRITVFTMQPMPGGNFRQEILGYSLMSALGINADEIK